MVIYPWKNVRDAVLLKMEERDYSQGMWSASRIWKIQRNTFSPRGYVEWNAALSTPYISPISTVLNFLPTEL